MKNRDKEAFTNLSVINSSSKKENLLETYFDFEDLKESKSKVRKNVLYQFLKWRYIRRYWSMYTYLRMIDYYFVCTLVLE